MDMKRGSLIIAFLVFLAAFHAALTIIPETVKATTLYVGGSGPGNYTTIQAAIVDANPGDTIFVYNGTYTEHILIDMSLALIGESRDTTIIDGGGSGPILHVIANQVYITGFNVMNAGSSSVNGKGIHFDSASNGRIINNTISMNERWGLELEYSDNAVIDNNQFVSNGNALYASNSDNVSIANNRLVDSYNAIIVTESNGPTISNNSVLDGMFNIGVGDGNDFTITGNVILSNANYGISVYRSQQGLIADNNVQNNSLGVFLESSRDVRIADNFLSNEIEGISLWMSDNITVANNTIYGSRDHGMRLVYATNHTIIDNVMVDNGIFIVGYKLDTWNSHTIETSNTVNGRPVYYWKNAKGGSVPSGAGEVILANCTEVIVENQDLSNSTVGMQLGLSPSNIILNVTASGNDQVGIYMIFSNNTVMNNVTVAENRHHGLESWWSDNMTVLNANASGNRIGFYAIESDDLRFEDNRAYMNFESGITFCNSNNSEARNNTIYSSLGMGSGLRFTHLTNSTVENNIALSSFVGISSVYTEDSNFTGNLAAGNIYGMMMDFACHYNIIEDNDFSNNMLGMSLEYSTNNTVSYNSITRNSITGVLFFLSHFNNVTWNLISENAVAGTNLTYSTNNRIHHNDFIDNPEQANDDDNTNQWDDGYPSGGNFWSDYTGVDQMSGPNQDQPGSDGLGDTPYTIDSDSQDRYPLMEPSLPGFMRPPVMSYSILSGTALGNVTVAWALSPDDGSGVRSVTGYEIYRNMTFNADGNGYLLLASLPNGTNQFVDSSVGEGDPNNYFYRVCAIGLNNTSKCASNQAGKFTRSLSEGVNLVSIPLLQSDESIGTVLQTLQWNKAWTYDAISQEWKSRMKSKPYGGTLQYVGHTVGLWVNVTQDSNLTVAGVVLTTTRINLQAGWNLVGFPSFDDNLTVADLKTVVPVERIEGFDALVPPYFLRIMSDGDFLQAGFGYWIRVESPAIWTIENV
jgi:parallel beta-helix repeat protein